MRDKYGLMLAEKASYPLSWIAARLKVSRSEFYSWPKRGCPEDVWEKTRTVAERV